MRGGTTIATDINEKWLLKQWQAAQQGDTRSFFSDVYNDLAENTFAITDKKILDKYKDSKFITKLQRTYTWDWEKEYDNGNNYNFKAELMTFSLNSFGEVTTDLTDLYLSRKDLDIPTMKYSYFFAVDNELRLTIPNQADDGKGLAYVNESGELIIDNNQW